MTYKKLICPDGPMKNRYRETSVSEDLRPVARNLEELFVAKAHAPYAPFKGARPVESFADFVLAPQTLFADISSRCPDHQLNDGLAQ